MIRDKKNIDILILSIALVASGILNISLAIEPKKKFYICAECKEGLVIGVSSGPIDLDPVRSDHRDSNNVIEQVCEGLYQHNLSDADLGIIPMLAADYGVWDISGTEFTVPLRRNVFFHDGTPFNAEAVKWNFERINYFLNASGTLSPTIGISPIHTLYEFSNGTTILDPITPVTIHNDYRVTINLRASYAILESLLCYITSYMLSPASTPKESYIDTASGDLVGTGPFVYDRYIAETEVKFHRWERYWRTGAFFEEFSFSIIEDTTTRNNAMLNHTIDYLSGPISSLFPTFDADPSITHHTGLGQLNYYYLGMNNNRINQTWRQAISYAINYTHIIDELQDGTVFRSNGPLAPDFPGYNASIQAATYDLAHARTIVQSMGFASGLVADAATTGANADAWRALALESMNYSYNIGNEFREDLGVLLDDNLDQIGINVIDKGCSWSDFITPSCFIMGPRFYDSLELFWVGWGPDYLSPYNMITPLFSNRSASNIVRYHSQAVEMWLDDVLSETNATKREELYSKILHQIVEIDMPHAFGYHPYIHSVHSADIRGVSYNAMGKFYAYPMYRDSNS